MNTIKVHKQQLQEALLGNREKHKETFEKAYEGFRKKVIHNLESRLDQAKNGGKINLYIGLVEPQDHTEDYNNAIEMLGWHTDEYIEITLKDFRQYVNDDWGWKRDFDTTNASYIND